MNKVAYKSVDELEHFRFDDCQIDTFAVTENGVELMVEALIVRADNSQNTIIQKAMPVRRRSG